jgi:sterol desaturase/sphingolipid hydroxylase (fatty acid hydroxylase superfamily)
MAGAMSGVERFLLFVVAPTVIALSFVEAIVLTLLHRRYDWRGIGVSYFDFVLRIVTQLLLPFTIVAPLYWLAQQHQLAKLTPDSWGTALLLFFGLEFCYYWLHRAAHRVRWLWCNHAVHHSPNQLNLAASVRIGAFGRLTGHIVFLLPLVWIGFDLRTVAAALTLNLLYQFWLHATWIPKLGFLEGILNTPSAHRVHHAANLEYLDANYGGVLVIFDRLFGTYIEERADVPCRYGWVHPITSANPLKVEFAQWAWLARDLRRARSVREVLGNLFMPPGWKASGESGTTEALRERAGVQPLRGLGAAVDSAVGAATTRT